MFVPLILACLAAGFVQGITGFGAGIIVMLVLPHLFGSIPRAAGVASSIGIPMCISMAYSYRKYVDFKKIIPPAILYISTCSVAMYFAPYINAAVMKKMLGTFLIILSVYYLFINKNTGKKKLSLPVSVFCIMVSAVCDGLFSIGGPLMVLYFLSITEDTKQYLGTLQAFFLINGTYNTMFRIMRGIIKISYLPYIAVGMVTMLASCIIATKLVDKIDQNILRKATYIMIGISGLLNVI